MKHLDLFDKVSKILEKYLIEKKLRKTPERFAILKEVYSMEENHFDIDTLYFQIIKNDFHISKATLYNNVTILIDAGILSKLQIEHNSNASFYERSFAIGQHDHVICVDCGKITEFCDPRIHEIETGIADSFNMSVSKHSLNVYAHCNDYKNCKEKKKLNKKSDI